MSGQLRAEQLDNFTGIRISIDSSGVCELVNTYATVVEHGGQLKLQGLTKRIRELATSTRLLAVFQIYDSEPATIVSFT